VIVMVVLFPSPKQRLQDQDLEFVHAEREFDLVFSALKAGRSLAASYNLQTDIQRTCSDLSPFQATVPYPK